MKTTIDNKNGQVYLAYKGSYFGVYPAGKISIEARKEKNLAVKLDISTLFGDTMENTLVNGAQLTPDNFDTLTKGINSTPVGTQEGSGAKNLNAMEGVVTNGTAEAFIDSLAGKVKKGDILVGSVEFEGMPAEGQADLTCTVYEAENGLAVGLDLASAATEPHRWFMDYQKGVTPGWKAYSSDKAVAQTGGVVYVNKMSASEKEDGSLVNPFKTIQKGIDAAAFGNIVSVFPGEGGYAEDIALTDVKNLTLQSMDGATNGQFRTVVGGSVTIKNSLRVQVTGFEFKSFAFENSQLVYADNCHLNSGKLVNAAGYHRFDRCFFSGGMEIARDNESKDVQVIDLAGCREEAKGAWALKDGYAKLTVENCTGFVVGHDAGSYTVRMSTLAVDENGTSVHSAAKEQGGIDELRLESASLIQPDGTCGKIDKTGDCKYYLGISLYDPANSALSGAKMAGGLHSDQVVDANKRTKLKPEDKSLKGWLDAVDTALAGDGGQIKDFAGSFPSVEKLNEGIPKGEEGQFAFVYGEGYDRPNVYTWNKDAGKWVEYKYFAIPPAAYKDCVAEYEEDIDFSEYAIDHQRVYSLGANKDGQLYFSFLNLERLVTFDGKTPLIRNSGINEDILVKDTEGKVMEEAVRGFVLMANGDLYARTDDGILKEVSYGVFEYVIDGLSQGYSTDGTVQTLLETNDGRIFFSVHKGVYQLTNDNGTYSMPEIVPSGESAYFIFYNKVTDEVIVQKNEDDGKKLYAIDKDNKMVLLTTIPEDMSDLCVDNSGTIYIKVESHLYKKGVDDKEFIPITSKFVNESLITDDISVTKLIYEPVRDAIFCSLANDDMTILDKEANHVQFLQKGLSFTDAEIVGGKLYLYTKYYSRVIYVYNPETNLFEELPYGLEERPNDGVRDIFTMNGETFAAFRGYFARLTAPRLYGVTHEGAREITDATATHSGLMLGRDRALCEYYSGGYSKVEYPPVAEGETEHIIDIPGDKHKVYLTVNESCILYPSAGMNDLVICVTSDNSEPKTIKFPSGYTILGGDAITFSYGVVMIYVTNIYISNFYDQSIVTFKTASQREMPPVHKTATIADSDWTQEGDFWQATVTDADVLDGALVDVAPDEASLKLFQDASFLPVTASETAGEFVVKCQNQPAGSINILYSIIL